MLIEVIAISSLFQENGFQLLYQNGGDMILGPPPPIPFNTHIQLLSTRRALGLLSQHIGHLQCQLSGMKRTLIFGEICRLRRALGDTRGKQSTAYF